MPTDNDPGDTRISGFTEDERSELRQLIQDAIAGAKPPEPPQSKAKPVTDDEWDKMSDRQRESWVRSLVDDVLDGLAREDADRRRDAEIADLKNKAQGPEPEGTPDPATPLDKLRKWLWGDDKA